MSDELASAAEASATGSTKACKICAQEIPEAARKCTKCDSFQDWRGRFNLSPTILSLLIALISTTVAALPVIQSYTAKDDSDIYVQFLSASPDGVSIVAVNRGTRPGFIGVGELRRQGGRPLYLRESDGVASTLVPSGQFVRLHYEGGVVPLFRRDATHTCELSFRIINFRSNRQRARTTIAC